MGTVTKFNLTRNKAFMKRSKADAKFFLKNFQWNRQQKIYLIKVSKKGYFVGKYNSAAKAFGKPTATDGHKKTVMTINRNFVGKRRNYKDSLSLFAL